VYLKVLKGIKTIHQANVTHYDIKCDNVMLTLRKPAQDATEADIDIAIGDFGTANLFFDEKDEFCPRVLGTECIKSPEMLMVEKHACKEDDRYDRRKKVGSTRLSDIWSAGCLFYELCTGDHLLHDEDLLVFLNRVISKDAELIAAEKAAKIDHNQYIMDFLRFILVRD
jgi:serine/threonine protein kinase